MLDSSLKAKSMEVMVTMSCKVIYEEFQPVEPEEVDRALLAVSLYVMPTCMSCPF